MNREDVIRMAREAGAVAGRPHPDMNEDMVFAQCMDVFRFASLVAAAKQDECIAECEAIGEGNRWSDAHDCIAAIRALK